MNFVRYLFQIKIPVQRYRTLLLAPIVGGGLYYLSQYQQYKFMNKIRERDLTLKLNASSIFTEHSMEYSNLIDISNQESIDSQQFQDSYTILFAGDLSQFKILQETIEQQLFNYNLKYLFIVSKTYYEDNQKYLDIFLKTNPKQQDLVVAYGNQSSLEADNIYCVLNDKLIHMQQIDNKNLSLLARTLSLKINKDLEKLFVKQIDF